MDVSITQFRQDIFDLVSQALEGTEIWITYKGRRVRIAPENQPSSRLARITPLQVASPDSPPAEDTRLREEMAHAWEKDWADI